MANALIGLDHVVLAVAALARAGADFERLGFTLSPRGRHPEWGTANRCLMFGRDYIELLAAEGNGPGADKVRQRLTDKGEGVLALAFGSRDAAKSHDLLARAGLAVDAVRPLSRPLETEDGVLMPRFNTMDLPAEATPGLPAFLCQHLTPDLLRRPEWLAHANGATGIASITAVVDQPTEMIPAYDRMFGPLSSTPTDDMVTVHTGSALIFLVTPDGFDHLHPHLRVALPSAPAIVGLALKVRDLHRTAEVLAGTGVSHQRQGPHVVPDPALSLGIGLEFVPE